MLRACGADEKEQVVHAIHKLKAVVHAVVPPAVLLDAKNAPGTSQSEVFHGRMAVVPPVVVIEVKKAPGTSQSEVFHGHMDGERVEADGQGSDRSEESEFFF